MISFESNTTSRRREARRPARWIVAAALALGWMASLCTAGETDLEQFPEVDAAVAKGLRFLAGQQQPGGAFVAGPRGNAVTALATAAFLASGHTPGVGKYGLIVQDALEFLLKQAGDSAAFGKADGSGIVGHAIVTFTLAEADGTQSGSDDRVRFRRALERAAAILAAAQTDPPSGRAADWVFDPWNGADDAGVCFWSVMALRESQRAGVALPPGKMRAIRDRILGCWNTQKRGFAWKKGAEVTLQATASAVCRLQLLDAAGRGEIRHAIPALAAARVNPAQPYGYWLLLMQTRGVFRHGEPVWNDVWKHVRESLLKSQMEDGGWPAPAPGAAEPGSRVYATAMAVLTLSAPYQLLPADHK